MTSDGVHHASAGTSAGSLLGLIVGAWRSLILDGAEFDVAEVPTDAIYILSKHD